MTRFPTGEFLQRNGSHPPAPRPNSPRRFRWKPLVEQLEERNLMTFFGGYRTVAELYTDMANTAANYPQITQLVTYGQSYSESVGGVTTPGGDFLPGYDLEAMEITNQAVPGPKPVFFLNLGIHAREITAPEVGMRFIDYLTQNYGSDPDVTWMVDYHDIWVVPVSNPDGHWYVELGTQPPYNGNPWLWRKNGHPNSCTTWPGSSGTSYGVDLNRNFDFHWGGVGSSNAPCSEIYRGPSAASEPETVALQNLWASLIPAQKGPNDDDPAPEDTTGIMIDVHTYGGQVLWPWGFTPKAPPNSSGLSAIGNKLATYNKYIAGQSYQTEYPTTGTTNDWLYGKLGAPGFTFELDSPGFLAPYSTVDPIWAKNKDAFLYAAKVARTPYVTAKGPDALSVAAGVNGSELDVSATINDTKNSNQNITAAEFYIDTPPWADGAVPLAMDAADGTFDEKIEDVVGAQSTDGLDPGRHILYVRGLDVAGYWGPVGAAFFDVPGAAVAGGGSPRWSRLVSAMVPAGTPSSVMAAAPMDGLFANGLDETHAPGALAMAPEPVLVSDPAFDQGSEHTPLAGVLGVVPAGGENAGALVPEGILDALRISKETSS